MGSLQGVEREAKGLVSFLTQKETTKEKLFESIHKDKTISEAVRRKALEFAEQRRTMPSDGSEKKK